MKHDYYYYKRQELKNQEAKMPFEILENEQAVFRAMAEEMITEIKNNTISKKPTVFICPVGPIGHYPHFITRVNEEHISLKDVWFINMDEYLTDEKTWIKMNESLSFRGFMDRNVYSKIKSELVMPKEQRIFPDPNKLDEIPELLKKLGGVDIAFGGIGINGHVAFNEADDTKSNEEFLNLSVRILEISRETRAVNSIGDLHGALDDMPKLCITIGMKEIYASRKIRLGCFRNWHRAVVRHALFGEASPHFPVTLLQNHSNIILRFPESVAQLSD